MKVGYTMDLESLLSMMLKLWVGLTLQGLAGNVRDDCYLPEPLHI